VSVSIECALIKLKLKRNMMDKMTKIVRFHELGGPEVLKIVFFAK
jgi:hypothetical protein